MRLLATLALSILLTSCGAPAVLYTDDVFRAAAPELVRAWKSLAPWKPARWVELPLGSGLASVEAGLRSAAPDEAVLVGLVLGAADRQRLISSFPGRKLVFFVPSAPGAATITVERVAAWEVVARASRPAGASGVVLYPADVTPGERERFANAWRQAGGGPLTSWIWPQTATITPETREIFQWVGPEADSRVSGLGASVAVNGNPGMALAPGTKGLTWRVAEEGLAAFLWNAAENSTKSTHFLPLETVPVIR